MRGGVRNEDDHARCLAPPLELGEACRHRRSDRLGAIAPTGRWH